MKVVRHILAVFASFAIYIIVFLLLGLISLLPWNIGQLPIAFVQIWIASIAAGVAIEFTASLFKNVNTSILYIGFLLLTLSTLILLSLNSYFFHFESIGDKVDFYVFIGQIIATYLGAWYGKSKVSVRSS